MLLSPFFLTQGGITISSTHALVSTTLLLKFEIHGIQRNSRIPEFSRCSSGLSPNSYSTVVLYDEQMQPVESAMRSLLNGWQPFEYVKVPPDSTIKFVCEVDTTYLRYANNSNTKPRKVLYKNVRFYKLFYRGPANRPRKAISDLESPLFSLQ